MTNATSGDRNEKPARHFRRIRFMRLSLSPASCRTRGAPGRDRSREDGRATVRGEAVVAGWPDVFIRAHLERSLRDSICPTIASVPSVEAARATETSGRWKRPGCRSAGVTGEDSPHYTNLSTPAKIDRVLVKIFFRGTGNVDRYQRFDFWTAQRRRAKNDWIV